MKNKKETTTRKVISKEFCPKCNKPMLFQVDKVMKGIKSQLNL